MLTTFLVVAWFMRKNPQQHIVTLWVCFFFFTVSLTIYYFTKAQDNKIRIVLTFFSSLSLTMGHWKFVWHYFCSANDAQQIIWSGVVNHAFNATKRKQRILIDWSVSAFMVVSFALASIQAWVRVTDGHSWKWGLDVNLQLIVYGIMSSCLLTVALIKINRLVNTQPEF